MRKKERKKERNWVTELSLLKKKEKKMQIIERKRKLTTNCVQTNDCC